MARRGGTTGIDTGARDADIIRINGCSRGGIIYGFPDTLRVLTAWAEFALAGAETVNFVQAGRILSLALRTHRDLFVEQVEVLARQHWAATDEKLFGSIDKAFKECNFVKLDNTQRQFRPAQ